MPDSVTVIGGGLAGSEAAFQLAARGVPATLHEMRPVVSSPAHSTGALAELVCSNSFKSDDPNTAPGMLKHELAAYGSLVLACARATALPAGAALAVDRDRFSQAVSETLADHPLVTIERGESTGMPEGEVIVATGPLSSSGFDAALSGLVGEERLAFFDAAAPIVGADSIDRGVCFAASRYDKGGEAAYLNCPMDEESYGTFVDALVSAERVEAREFESRELFAACQPIEEVARTGRDAIRFGALKPVGLTDPATGRRPWAVVQLRRENASGGAYNLVGFQTNLTFSEQARVFRLVPGLSGAEFLRYGVMHRNTFVDAPRLLSADLALRTLPRVRLAGQLTGTEGYLEAAMSGLLAALGTFASLRGLEAPRLPAETAFGALVAYATDAATEPYQPMHVNFGLIPPLLDPPRSRRERRSATAARGRECATAYVSERADLGFEAARDALGRSAAVCS